MEISKRSRTPQFEVPELIQMVQSFLPAKEAARTMVLSKSWLHAWSTSPTLRIRVTRNSFITSDPFTLLDEIFSRENLSTISVKSSLRYNFLWIPVIKCVSLQVLELVDVCISEDVLDNLFSTCTLLEKINIEFRNRLETIKVRRLSFLRELKITSTRENCNLEFYDVPSLCSFAYKWRDALALMSDSIGRYGEPLLNPGKALAFNSDSFESMKKLCLSGVIMNRTLLDTINSKFPFLESLTIHMECCWLYRVDITCVSLKRLILRLKENKIMEVHVYATQLLSFHYEGTTMPNLSFPTSAPREIEIELKLSTQINMPFFIRMMEALNISSKFNIKIINMSGYCTVPCNIKVDDLKGRVVFPATYVEEVSFTGFLTNHLWEKSSLFDTLISICYPNYVKVLSINSNYSWKLIVESMIKWSTSQSDLKDVEIRYHSDRIWETLRYVPISSLDELRCNPYSAMFKLNWSSP